MERADLFERVRERVVPDVVQQSSDAHGGAGCLRDSSKGAPVVEQCEGATREMIGAKRVLEAAMGGAGVDEKREPELANVAQPLKRRRIHEPNRQLVDGDVVPE